MLEQELPELPAQMGQVLGILCFTWVSCILSGALDLPSDGSKSHVL